MPCTARSTSIATPQSLNTQKPAALSRRAPSRLRHLEEHLLVAGGDVEFEHRVLEARAANQRPVAAGIQAEMQPVLLAPADLGVVAFVQDDSDKEILQAGALSADETSVGDDDVWAGLSIKHVFPNPFGASARASRPLLTSPVPVPTLALTGARDGCMDTRMHDLAMRDEWESRHPRRRPVLGSELNSTGETPLASHLSRCISPIGGRRSV